MSFLIYGACYGEMGLVGNVRVRPKLMSFIQGTLSQTGEVHDAAAPTLHVHAVQEERCNCAVRGECVEDCCGVGVWAVVEGKGYRAGDGAVVDDGAGRDERESVLVVRKSVVERDGAELVVWSADYACLGDSRCCEQKRENVGWMHVERMNVDHGFWW